MADAGPTATRRVFIEDVRRNDAYLRATWHPETRVIVISHWNGTPIPVHEAGGLIHLLVTALEEAAAPPRADRLSTSPALPTRMRTLFDRLALRLGLRTPSAPAQPVAAPRTFDRRATRRQA